MRIGIDIRELEKGKTTGIGRYLSGLLLYASVHKKEWEFVLFGNQYTCFDIEAGNFRKIIITESLRIWWDQVSLPANILKEKIDVFFTPYFKAPVYCPAKLVLVVNDIIPLASAVYADIKNLPMRLYYRQFLGASIKRADRIIAISNHTKADIIKQFSAPEEKITVVPLAVDESFFPKETGGSEILSKYGVSGKYIFYFGNFNPHKNIAGLINAYKSLPEKLKTEYTLVLGGKKDKNCAGLLKLIKELGL